MMDFRTFTATRALQAIVAMALVVVASNILVQYPVSGKLGTIDLADLLTWGAFTYPAAFLVTDLTNRRFAPQPPARWCSSASRSPSRFRSSSPHRASP